MEPRPTPESRPNGDADQQADHDQCMWAMLCHLAGLAVVIVPIIGGMLGPLVIWMLKRDGNPFVDQQGKEALNFQISIFVLYALLAVLSAIGLVCLAGPLLLLVTCVGILFSVVGGIKANQGEEYRYPLRYEFLN